MDGPLSSTSAEGSPRLRHPKPSTSAPSSPHRILSAPQPPPAAISESLPTSPQRRSMGATPSRRLSSPPAAQSRRSSHQAAAGPTAAGRHTSIQSADVFVMEHAGGMDTNANHFGDPAAFEGAPFWEEQRSASEVYIPRPYYPPEKPKGLFSGQKGLVIVFLLVLVVFVVGLIAGIALRSQCANRMVYVLRGRHNYDPKLSKYMQSSVEADEMRLELQWFSKQPHQAGSEANFKLAEKIYNAWYHLKAFDELFFDNYTVQVSLATAANTVELINATSGGLVFNATSSSEKEDGILPYLAFSPAGSLEDEYIFINYGSTGDMKLLADLKVNLTGRIAIARIGNGYRSGAAVHASRAGAIGLVLYPDPEDFAPDQSKVFPKGWWLPGDAPVFGNMRTKGGGGDPLTPDLPAVDGASPTRRSDNSTIEFSPIPVQPIGYNDARQLLGYLGGPPVPKKWAGSLAKRIGPAANLRLRLRTHNKLFKRRIQNVIAVLRGDPEPDRLVVLGNHYDAWIHGAHDPLSGTVIVQEVSKLFAKEIGKAYRPRRTLVFAAWDAEEMGTIGSTEFTERLSLRLGAQAVAYVNLDCPVKGNYSFFARTSPLLRSVVKAAAGSVKLQGTDTTVLADWRVKLPANASDPSAGPEQPMLGGGSDQGAFLFKLGVPSTYPQYMYNGFVPQMPAYHTRYDIFPMMNDIIDPGFKNHATVARVVIDLLLRLADSTLLPLELGEYPKEMRRFAEHLKDQASQYEPLKDGSINLNILFAAIDELQLAVDSFMTKAKSIDPSHYMKFRMANDAMMQVSRGFLWSEGLPSRSYFKNVLLSQGLTNSYKGSFLTGLYDALYLGTKTRQWEPAYRHFWILVNAIRGVSLLLKGVMI